MKMLKRLLVRLFKGDKVRYSGDYSVGDLKRVWKRCNAEMKQHGFRPMRFKRMTVRVTRWEHRRRIPGGYLNGETYTLPGGTEFEIGTTDQARDHEYAHIWEARAGIGPHDPRLRPVLEGIGRSTWRSFFGKRVPRCQMGVCRTRVQHGHRDHRVTFHFEVDEETLECT